MGPRKPQLALSVLGLSVHLPAPACPYPTWFQPSFPGSIIRYLGFPGGASNRARPLTRQLSFPSVVCRASSLPSGSSQARPPCACPHIHHLGPGLLPPAHILFAFEEPSEVPPPPRDLSNGLEIIPFLPESPPPDWEFNAVCLMLSNVTEWQMQDRCPGWPPQGQGCMALPAGGGQQGPVLGSTRRVGIE